MEEGAEAVRADDVHDRLDHVQLALDDDLGIRVRRGRERRRNGRANRLARLYGQISVSYERPGCNEQQHTLTTQMGLERIEVAAPALSESARPT